MYGGIDRLSGWLAGHVSDLGAEGLRDTLTMSAEKHSAAHGTESHLCASQVIESAFSVPAIYASASAKEPRLTPGGISVEHSFPPGRKVRSLAGDRSRRPLSYPRSRPPGTAAIQLASSATRLSSSIPICRSLSVSMARSNSSEPHHVRNLVEAVMGFSVR